MRCFLSSPARGHCSVRRSARTGMGACEEGLCNGSALLLPSMLGAHFSQRLQRALQPNPSLVYFLRPFWKASVWYVSGILVFSFPLAPDQSYRLSVSQLWVLGSPERSKGYLLPQISIGWYSPEHSEGDPPPRRFVLSLTQFR